MRGGLLTRPRSTCWRKQAPFWILLFSFLSLNLFAISGEESVRKLLNTFQSNCVYVLCFYELNLKFGSKNWQVLSFNTKQKDDSVFNKEHLKSMARYIYMINVTHFTCYKEHLKPWAVLVHDTTWKQQTAKIASVSRTKWSFSTSDTISRRCHNFHSIKHLIRCLPNQ